MALVVNPANPVADTQSTDMLAAARTIGVTLHILHSSSRSDLDALLAPAAELGVRAFVIGSEQAFSKPTWQSAFAALAAQHKIPAVSSNPGFVTAGGLMSYGNNSSEAHYICGVYTGRILKGAKPRAQESRTAPRDQAPLRPSCLWLTRPWWTAALVNPLLVAA
jgi:putative tryptophan/tyrosine transport system substrate-binding protein